MRFILYLILSVLLSLPSYANIRFLSISDIHYGNEHIYGEGHDTTPELFSTAMVKFTELAKQVDFIITLGDFPTHQWGSAGKENFLKTVFHELFKADKANKPMFYITGNNDSLRGNYQPFSLNGKSPLSFATEWQGACAHCSGLMINDKHLLNNGYYASYVVPHNKDILLIALNTQQFAQMPLFVHQYPNQEKDALEQLRWLDELLKNHHAKQLLIAMHVPPGKNHRGGDNWKISYLNQFINILNKRQNHFGQISLLTSHSHRDEIRKIHLNNEMNIYAYGTPSISRIYNNNSGMKVFELNKDDKMQNYKTYYSDSSQRWGNNKYSAIKGKNSIFPNCDHVNLVQCLDALSDESFCEKLNKGKFYGVKNRRVDGSVCKMTFAINHPHNH